MLHKQPSELAGKEVLLRDDVKHPQYPDLGGSKVRVEDWWDRLGSKSWMDCRGNPACFIYALRGIGFLPVDDEVLYAKYTPPGSLMNFGVLIHISELAE